MADHWKSIANLLGAPGVDEPEPEIKETEHVVDEFAADDSQGEGLTLAETPPEAPRTGKPKIVDEERRSDLAARDSQRSELPEPVASQAPSKPVPRVEPKPEPDVAAKPRKKSSWESLASMFNVKIDRSVPPPEESPAAAELPPKIQDDVAERDVAACDSPLTIFDAETTEESNPALDAMFADVPRESFDRKPAPRIVDDLGWDEDQPPAESSERTQAEIVDEDEAPRRGRRRRRRGRRGGTSEAAGREAADREVGDREVGWEARDLDSSESEDDWQEPESFTPREEEAELDTASDDIHPDLTDRRSSRRRRRGRGRDRQVSDELERPSRSDVSPVDAVEDEDIELGEPSRAPAAHRTDDRGPARSRRGSSNEGRRRSSENRPPAPEAERAPESEPEFDFDDADDDSARGTTKHRNIPTWADSIQSLVEANIDNRRRNDNRGGPRGRPRGRR